MFYVKACQYCKVGNQILETSANQASKDGNEMRFGRIECNENMYECLRFNITKVPTIIIIEKGYYFQENNYLTENSLMSFIKNEKEFEKGKEVPPTFGWLQFFMRSLQETMTQLNIYIKNFLNNTFDLKFEWGMTHSMFLFLILFIIIFVVEYYVLSYCMRKKKVTNIPKAAENQKSEEIKESEEGKKENTEATNGKEKKE